MPALRPQNKVEYFELFFDLVFVFALIQITRTIADDGTLTGILHGTVVLLLAWWVWVSFTSMANMGLPESDRREWRPLIFAVAMGPLLLMALSIPEAFWAGGKLFAYSYLALAVIAAGGQLWISSYDPDTFRAVKRLWSVGIILPIIVVITSYVPDETVSVILITIGIISAIAAPFAAGTRNLPISTSHLAERYALFMLITLGESIISIGEGATGATIDALLIISVLIALALVVLLWRHYAVAVLDTGEQALERLHGRRLTTFARHAYTLTHLPMVWGIVMVAVAIKTALGDLETPLDDLLEAGLAVGALAFLAATAIFSTMAGSRIRPMMIVSLALLATLIFIGPSIPTVLLIVAVTIATGLGIDPRAIGLRQINRDVPAPAE